MDTSSRPWETPSVPPSQDALQAILSAQSAIEKEAWPQEMGSVTVRAALHTGTPEEWDGDYFGPPVNRVARLLLAGHGGQTLLSLPTQELVRDYLPPGVELLDLGERRLKDLFRPERVYQVLGPDLPSRFPPLKTLDIRPNNLPVQPTPLIGREKELLEISQLLRQPHVHVVTLTGPGGTGKTRLALQTAADLVDHFEGGAYFVNLAPIADVDQVVPTIAQVLGVKEAPGQPLIENLKSHLKETELLLLLDNFEQVIPAGIQIADLLTAAPKVKVLITSREPLQIRGEHNYSVPPLALPDGKQLPPLERLTQYEAVRLFIERAVAAKPDFSATNQNAPAIAEICARLDGLPLAIELAAARIRLLTPQAMLSRLQNRLKLLTGGAKDLPARQQTLRSAIEWSHDLLNPEEQKLFRRLAVFVGGRTLEAIEAVCNAQGDLVLDVLDAIQSLVDKSLMRQEKGVAEQPRFVMLETIHEFAREKLEQSGEAEITQWNHANYFLALAEQAYPKFNKPDGALWKQRLLEDHDNLRQALNTILEQRESTEDPSVEEMGLRLAGALWRFWYGSYYMREGLDYLSKALARGGMDVAERQAELDAQSVSITGSRLSAARALAYTGANTLAWQTGELQAAQAFGQAALKLYKQLGDSEGIMTCLTGLGNTAMKTGNLKAAQALWEQALAVGRTLPDAALLGGILGNLSNIFKDQGNYDEARQLLEEQLKLNRESGNQSGVAWALRKLGDVAISQGQLTLAASLLEESLEMYRAFGEGDYYFARVLLSLGELARSQSDYTKAHKLYGESMEHFQKAGAKPDLAYVLANLAHVALFEGNIDQASELFRQSLAIFTELGLVDGIALCLAGFGGIGEARKQPERASRLLAASEALLQSGEVRWEPVDVAEYERSLVTARTQLDEAGWQRAWQAGQAMSMEQAVEYALEDAEHE